MKTTFKFIIAAMAASAVFASCQKELATGNPSESTDGIRVISASFSAPTKSALDTDNKTPKFVGGEEIKVSNATESQVRQISIDASGNAYFSTTLSGTLTAVYPSTAAKMNGNVIDETTVLVSTVQDGTFASANIAMATGITTSATFTNKTAVIAITPGAGSNSNYVEVITAGPEIANSTSGAYTKKNKIHVNVNTATTYPVYVSILVPSGLKVKNLSFADGKNIKTAKDNTAAIAVNTINTVSGETSTWNTPYVEIRSLKWATMNIGAASVSDAGHYFAWGYAEGCVRNTAGSGWVLASDNTIEKYFNTGDFPDRDASSFQDAATSNWGGSWRMPTKDEFGDLITYAIPTPDQYGSQDGVFFSYHGKEIFLPTAGYGESSILMNQDENYYWSSSHHVSYSSHGWSLYIQQNNPQTQDFESSFGFLVRAISD